MTSPHLALCEWRACGEALASNSEIASALLPKFGCTLRRETNTVLRTIYNHN